MPFLRFLCRLLILSWLARILLSSISTDTVLDLMTFWTINTGVVTALLSVMVLVAVSLDSAAENYLIHSVRLDLQFARAHFHFVVLTLGVVSFITIKRKRNRCLLVSDLWHFIAPQ